MKINPDLITSEYNVVDNGNEVKTGIKYNGKDVYLKRYFFDNIRTANTTYSKDLGLTLSSITVYKIEGVAYSNSSNWFNIPMGDYNNATTWTLKYQLTNSNNKIELTVANSNFTNAYINIYYIYN